MNLSRHLSSSVLSKTRKARKNFIELDGCRIPQYVGEFWTSKQRQVSSIHEISYRACFKAQLPRFFIEFLTNEGDTVFDPFSGRGTTAIEAGLLGRNIIANDVNPLSEILCRPRLDVPNLDELSTRLSSVRINKDLRAEIDLSMFYHFATEAEIVSLKNYLDLRRRRGVEDSLDRWIRMVATNRLTGHSKGFFSVYTLPPNQAVTPERQRRINKRLRQKAEYRNVREIILRKSKTLMRNLLPAEADRLHRAGTSATFLTGEAGNLSAIPSRSVKLTVTSPPFLDIVNYTDDNWLRCWFNGIDSRTVARQCKGVRTLDEWCKLIGTAFEQLYRVTDAGGWVAFEVGELRKGTIRLEEFVVPLGHSAGFRCEGIIINTQKFTKTSNIWGIKNNVRGTNTNRIVLFHKAV